MGQAIFQVLSALILHFNCLTLGLIAAWPSSTLLLFKSDATPLHRPMVDSEIALLGSLSAIGALVSNPLAGIFLDRLGRKRCAIIAATIGALAWSLVVVSSRVEVILTAILMSGLSGSVFLVVPVFVSEFSEESIRGTLTSGAVVFYGLGMLLSYLFGGFLSYKVMVSVCLSLSVTGIMLLMLIKESPMLLMKKGLEEEARKSMAFYRNAKPDSKIVLQELDKIRHALAPEEREMLSSEEQKLTSEVREKVPAEKLNVFQFFKKSKSTQRALIVSLTLMTAAIFQGMVVVQVYAKPLFSEAVPEELLSPTWCCVLLALVSVVSGLIAAYLTDLAGRRLIIAGGWCCVFLALASVMSTLIATYVTDLAGRWTLMIYSSLAAGACCIALGTQIHLSWGPPWLTAVFIYMFCASFTLGAGTVPFVLLAELFLPEVRSIISMVVMEWTWLCSFIVLFIFNPLVAAIGLGPIFYLFACVCFFTSAFSVFFLPETKGLPVDAIQLLFVKQKKHDLI